MSHPDHPPVDCPVCLQPLTPLAVGKTVVDVCHGSCGGVWCDHFELQKLDEHHEGEGKLIAHIERHPEITRDPSVRLKCPRCRDVVLRQHFFSVKQKVEVDSCPGCGGYWLDHGELAMIRSEFATTAAREAATAKFLEDLDNQHTNKPCPDALDQSSRTQSLAAMFKLMGSRYL